MASINSFLFNNGLEKHKPQIKMPQLRLDEAKQSKYLVSLPQTDGSTLGNNCVVGSLIVEDIRGLYHIQYADL